MGNDEPRCHTDVPQDPNKDFAFFLQTPEGHRMAKEQGFTPNNEGIFDVQREDRLERNDEKLALYSRNKSDAPPEDEKTDFEKGNERLMQIGGELSSQAERAGTTGGFERRPTIQVTRGRGQNPAPEPQIYRPASERKRMFFDMGRRGR